MENKLPHQHLLINAETNDLKNFLTIEKIEEHLRKIVDLIESVIIIEPQVEYCDSHNNTGFMGICGVGTSHISCHHWDNTIPQRLQFDIYSCTKFDFKKLSKEIIEFWQIKSGSILVIDRSVDFGFNVIYSANI
jgi:S-adenosylmethionine/arginine decarboxylase-like enzyme